jgi:hypothetical protein
MQIFGRIGMPSGSQFGDTDLQCTGRQPAASAPIGESHPEAHALGDLEARDDTSLDLLAGLAGSFAASLSANKLESESLTTRRSATFFSVYAMLYESAILVIQFLAKLKRD